MVYSWKIGGLYKVSAQAAGEELERIREENGSLTAQAVVEESRSEDAVLHGCFDWDDEEAAESWRRQQARNMIACITVRDESIHPTEPVRLFVNVEDHTGYHPIQAVITNDDLYQRLLQQAMKELQDFKKKYNVLSEISPVREVLEAIAQ